MSITCSIPGCNGRNITAKQTKLYRIPAIPIASSGFIHDLSNTRRQKWMAILQNCGLTEENSVNFRVCSNHFAEGKPAPTFDSKNPDWVPHINLGPGAPETLVVEKRKGRPRKKSISMGSQKKSQSRSKSTSRAVTPERSIQGRSRSVNRTRKPKSEEQDEKNDPPFVFVDIQKIKEGVSIADMAQTSATNKKIMNRSLRNFGTQTNPNILPPLNWGKNRSKKQDDPRYRSTGVQVGTTNEEPPETCLGEMIDYIRKHMLEFIFAPFGKNYKITECAIHLEKQISSENQEIEKSVVIVQSNKLLSSNWPLLETIAKSLDLHKKEKKKEKNNTGLVRTSTGKKETLDYLSSLLAKSVERIAKAQIPNVQEDAPTSPVKSPTVTPKISSVASMVDLFEDEPMESPKKRNTLRLIEVPSTDAVPKVSNLSEQVGIQKKTAKRTNSKNIDVSKKLGTDKVPKIILTKLPDSVVNAAKNGGTISVAMLSNPKDSTKNNCPNKNPGVPSVPNPFIHANQVKNPTQLCLANALPPTMSTVKNIPLKLPEKKGIAGYLVLSKSNTSSNPYVYVVPGAQLAQDQSKPPELGIPDPNISRLFATPSSNATTTVTPVFPVTSTPIVNMIAPVVDPKTPTITPKTPSTAPKTIVVSPKTTVEAPKTSLESPKTSLMSPKTSLEGLKPSVLGTKLSVAEPKTPVGSPHKMEQEPDKTSSGSSKADNTLRCPYCKCECKDGVEFIVHYKTCKGKRNNANVMQRCEKCKKFYAKSQPHTCELPQPQLLHCNVCGRGFIKCANLANHLKIHPEYSLWPHKCLQCPRKFETEKLLQEHGEQCEMLSMNKKTYPCKLCKKIFIIESRLEAHVKNVHLNKANSPSPGKNVKVKCRRCENIFDLKYYRSTHWKLCKPATDSDNEENGGGKTENARKIGMDGKPIPDITARAETANIKLVKKIGTMEAHKKAGNSTKAESVKKMTGIRSFPIETSSDDDLGASIEDQLQKMFQDDVEKSKCEEVTLSEDFEEKIAQNEINTDSRKRKLQDVEKSPNDYDDLLEIKVSRMNDGNSFNETLSNGISIDEINTEIDGEVCLQSTFDMTDCLNEISFEEVEDVEYSDS